MAAARQVRRALLRTRASLIEQRPRAEHNAGRYHLSLSLVSVITTQFFRAANWRYAPAGEATLGKVQMTFLILLSFQSHPQETDMRIPTVLKTLLGIAGAAAVLGAAHGQATAPGQATPPGQAGSRGQATAPAGQQPSAAGATGAAATAGSLSKADQKMIMDMAQGNMSEIETAKLAQSKSQNDQVKTFAQQMIDDHTKALAEVQQLASSKGVTLPTEPDKKHKAIADKLGGLSGAAFDKSYMKQAGLADHKKMHSLLATAQSKAKDPDIKALAAKLMPTVDQHLKAAQQMGSAKGSAKGTAKDATAAGK
jgi:putative membrane protein